MRRSHSCYMKKTTPVLVLLILLGNIAILFSRCAKEYSYEGGPVTDTTTVPVPPVTPDAGFTLSGSPADCAEPGIGGTYTAGTKFTSANYVALFVDVTSLGKYNITTDTIDGISFGSSGVFTQTGRQQVTLQGKGTPVLPRNLVFHTNAGSSACDFQLAVVTPGAPASYVLESSYDTTCTGHIVEGAYTAGTALNNSNKVSVRVYVAVPGVYTLATETVNGMMFSYTGEFAAVGNAMVDLVGEGTPGIIGIFPFHLHIVGPAPLGGSGCIFDIPVK